MIVMPDDISWLVLGDFNLIRSREDRNNPGGNVQDMLAFNEAISSLRLVELLLRGCKYTWTNKQQNPLLERLDRFFSSNAWTTLFPKTFSSGLSRDTSDHIPCLITASTNVPRPQTFRFENYWLEHENFIPVLQHAWQLQTMTDDSAKKISAKFKNLRRALKAWKSQLPNLAAAIQNAKDQIQFFDMVEENRDLTLQEWNFRWAVSNHLEKLLHQQRIYWKQRGKINWVKFGDECTKFFHANASSRHTKNYITSLVN
jgi:hypothetical protein